MSFSITPSLPVNALPSAISPVPKDVALAYNANYFPNTSTPLQGPVFWKRMIEETQKANSSIDMFIFEMKPYGLYSYQWYKALLAKASNKNVKIRLIVEPPCSPVDPEILTDKCRIDWTDPSCKSACEGITSTNTDMLLELEKAGCQIVPYFGSQIMGNLCTNFGNFSRQTGVTTNLNVCENSGDLHVKLFIFDNQTFYIGSANTDEAAAHEFGIWLTEPELAVEMTTQFQLTLDVAQNYITNKETLLQFVRKITGDNTITQANLNEKAYRNPKWPKKYQTKYSLENPLHTTLTNEGENSPDKGAKSDCKIYISVSPMIFCPPDWTWDYLAWMDLINTAEKSLYITNFDLSPTFMFANPGPDISEGEFICNQMASQEGWPFCAIFVALEMAAYRGVDVRLMGGTWPHQGRDYFIPWGKKVNQVCAQKKSKGSISASYWPNGNIQKDPVVMSSWPTLPPSSDQPAIYKPGPSGDLQWGWNGGVMHDKYGVSDTKVLISTNNASGTYFTITNGMSVVIETKGQLRDEVQNYFNTVWFGPFSGANIWKKTHLPRNCSKESCYDQDVLIGYSNPAGVCTAGKPNDNVLYRKNEWIGKPFMCIGSNEPPSTDCNGQTDCGPGQNCVKGKCVPQPASCRFDADCPNGGVCTQSRKCVSAPAVQKPKKWWIMWIVLGVAITLAFLIFFIVYIVRGSTRW